MLSGLVPDLAAGLGVSVSAAGSLTSAFAVGMIVGAPLMAVVSRRWARRGSLLGFLGAFLLAHVVGAVTMTSLYCSSVGLWGHWPTPGFLPSLS